MIDREKVLTVLHRRFPGSSAQQIAGAANAIVGLEDEWEELASLREEVGQHCVIECGASCHLAPLVRAGREFRIFARRPETDPSCG